MPGKILFLALALASVNGALAQTAAVRGLPGRELDQMIDSIRRSQLEQQAERQRAPEAPALAPAKKEEGRKAFVFELKELAHSPSEVLSEEEFQEAVKPWVGKPVTGQDLLDILHAVNEVYRKKGYAVCRAILRPQTIANGKLLITLIEGKTDQVKITGNRWTRDAYITESFDLPEGKVANYADMVDDLIRFNMTNSMQLRIDISPGSKPGTTSYEIIADEPDYVRGNIFADSTGTYSTGRLRAGTGVEFTSLTGMRDELTILGVKSRGTTMGYAAYSFPLNTFGTRLVFSASAGKVKVVKGMSKDLDVTGRSKNFSLQFEHPAYVSGSAKVTPFFRFSRQKSYTDMFEDIRMSHNTITSAAIGTEAFRTKNGSLLFGSLSLSRESILNELFETRTHAYLFTGSASARADLTPAWTALGRFGWQAKLGGDPLPSSECFYLGQTSGVRGYPNDILSAENGWYANAELHRRLPKNLGSVFAFADVGRLSGESFYTRRTLASAGFGVSASAFKHVSGSLTFSFPFVRNTGEMTEHVSKARADFSLSITW